MFGEIGAAKIFVVFNTFSFVVVFFNDSNSTRGIPESGNENAKFRNGRVIVVFDSCWNIVDIDSILIDRIDLYELIPVITFTSPYRLQGKDRDVEIIINTCNEGVNTIEPVNMDLKSNNRFIRFCLFISNG